MDSRNSTAATTPTPAGKVRCCLWRGRIISFPHIFHALCISRGFWPCHGQRYAECDDISDELMTFLLSTDGTLSVSCLINKRIRFLIILLPWVLRFRLLFSSSVSLHHPDFSAAVHPSLPSCISPFSLVLFLLLRLLSALHSFSSLPYPVALPVAPVISFPSLSHVGCCFFFSAYKVFPLPLLSSVVACQLWLWLQLFLRLSFSRPLFLFGVGSSTFSGSSFFFFFFFFFLLVPLSFSLGSSTPASSSVIPFVAFVP